MARPSKKRKNSPGYLSWHMAQIPSANTKPELRVRKIAHRLGYRFRLHARELPGRPDIVFRPRRKVIFVHGCFFHRHNCGLGKKEPRANRSYWLPKFARNVARDATNVRRLEASGWRVLVIWECQTKHADDLVGVLTKFLGPTKI